MVDRAVTVTMIASSACSRRAFLSITRARAAAALPPQMATEAPARAPSARGHLILRLTSMEKATVAKTPVTSTVTEPTVRCESSSAVIRAPRRAMPVRRKFLAHSSMPAMARVSSLMK